MKIHASASCMPTLGHCSLHWPVLLLLLVVIVVYNIVL
jgi:hypothetical protein